jgi:hypothetical protein
MITYERRLNQNPRWALLEGSMHFEERSAVHQTLKKVVKRLEELSISYAVAGAMALFLHGFRRFTEDVNVLVTHASLQEIHRQLGGSGYSPFTGSKDLRDTDSGVRIEFLVTGDYPGDSKPKPLAFPDPATVRTEIDGIQLLSLPSLVELKLASGMTNPLRLKDLADVQELVQRLRLPADFADRLNPLRAGKIQGVVDSDTQSSGLSRVRPSRFCLGAACWFTT